MNLQCLNYNIMLHELKSIKYTVKSILNSKPETRDNDNLLIQEVWLSQFPGLLNMNAERLLLHMKMKRLCSTKSIIRNRQRIQQEGEFRGKFYNERHQEAGIVRSYFTNSNFKLNTIK